jgi:hypothetical protein
VRICKANAPAHTCICDSSHRGQGQRSRPAYGRIDPGEDSTPACGREQGYEAAKAQRAAPALVMPRLWRGTYKVGERVRAQTVRDSTYRAHRSHGVVPCKPMEVTRGARARRTQTGALVARAGARGGREAEANDEGKRQG